MEFPKRGSGSFLTSSSRIISGVLVIAILAAVIPAVVVVTLQKRNSMGPKSAVLLPLYVYPAPGTWDPLMDV
jgi:hypothetical protein